jgi:hypothetical protein
MGTSLYARGHRTRTPAVVYHQQTTNVSILSFMQNLWGLAPLTPLNKKQNDLMSVFNFKQSLLPAPASPVSRCRSSFPPLVTTGSLPPAPAAAWVGSPSMSG